ncbi:MAG: hypothetical protein ISS74_05535 [Planctomycetes bacterium]|nr:hypothetical protein [Planctomycetota bacterium]
MKNLSLACAISLLVLLCGAGKCLAAIPTAKKAPAPLTDEQKQAIQKLTDEFRDAKTPAQRLAPLKRIVGMGPEAAGMANAAVDELLAVCQKQYFEVLDKYVRNAYLKRLTMLNDGHIRKVQYMRRLWKDYLEHTSDQHEFQDNFLKPVWDVAEFLILKPEQMTEPEIVQARQRLFELAEYQEACRKAAGIGQDPTAARKSPTGIAIPNLDQPQTLADYVSFLDRTMALAGSFAPEGGKKVLYEGIEVSRLIDVQESEFILYCETVRMLVGSVAWVGNELVCAATRDHSTDRKEGRASGHMSTVPGKKGFTDRLRRMGAPFCGAEGAGGGRSGPGYAYNLSYGGGHTHPLYSIKRNFTGVGRRGEVYTSNYGTNKEWLHPCPVTEKELFMPPGITKDDIQTPELLEIYKSLQEENFAQAYTQIAATKVKADFDKMILRFFSAAVTAELDWFFEGVVAIDQVGDYYDVKLRLEGTRKKFTGIPLFDKRAATLDKHLSGKQMEKELEAGKAYRPIATAIIKDLRANKLNEDAAHRQLVDFAVQYPKTVCAEAALFHPPADKRGRGGAVNPIAYFFNKNPSLAKYAYYTYGLEVSDEWPPPRR